MGGVIAIGIRCDIRALACWDQACTAAVWRQVCAGERSPGVRRGMTFCPGMETLPEPRHKQAFSLGLPLGGSSSSKWGYLGVLVTILDPLTVAFPSSAQNVLVPQMRKFYFEDQCSSCSCHTGSDGDRWLLGYRLVGSRAHWAPPQQ